MRGGDGRGIEVTEEEEEEEEGAFRERKERKTYINPLVVFV